jgi:hypothetical protein
MVDKTIVTKAGRGIALAGALVAGVGFVAIPRPAHAFPVGAAVGVGLGAFALGTAVGSAADPYYYGYPYGYYAPPNPYYGYYPGPSYYYGY